MNKIRHPQVQRHAAGRRPTVSVIVPCFNYGHWLAECVDSALNQADVDVDVTIIDDASSDSSAEVATTLVRERGGRVRLISNPTNLGHILSVNEGFRHAQGEYLVKLDADDMLAPGSLSRSTALLDACPSVGFVYGRPLHFGRDVDATMSRLHKVLRRSSFLKTDRPTDYLRQYKLRGWSLWPGHSWIERICDRAANCISQPEVVIRASEFKKVGPYDSSLPHTSDLGMWLRLASIADVGHIDGPIQGFYRVHATSMQRTVNSGKLRDLDGRLSAFETVLNDPDNPVANSGQMLRRARNRLASEALEEATRAFDRGRAGSVPIDSYAEFARRASTEVKHLSQWRALEWRRRIGVRWAPMFPPFLLQAALRPAMDELQAARWWRYGT